MNIDRKFFEQELKKIKNIFVCVCVCVCNMESFIEMEFGLTLCQTHYKLYFIIFKTLRERYFYSPFCG